MTSGRTRCRRLQSGRSTRTFALVCLGLLNLGHASAVRALPLNFAGSTTVAAETDPHWSSAWFTHALDRRNGLGVSIQFLPAVDVPVPVRRTVYRPDLFNGLQVLEEGSGDPLTGQAQETFALVDWTHLVQRWNLSRAQANLWLFAGVGLYHSSGSSGAASHSGGEQGSSHSMDGRMPARRGTEPSSLRAAMDEGIPGDIVELRSTPVEPSWRIAGSPGLQFDIETSRLRLEARGRVYLAPGVQRSQLSATAGAALTPPSYQGVQPWAELQVRALPGVIDGVELIPKLRLLQRRLVLEVGYSSLGSVVGGFIFTL
ncbi:MAG: hypothetical protein ACKO0M_14035 [Cyanobium sp.]